MKLKQIDFNAELIGQDGIVVKTMDGRDVKQLTFFKCVNRYSLWGTIDEELFQWPTDGKYSYNKISSDYDLIMYKQVKVMTVDEFYDEWHYSEDDCVYEFAHKLAAAIKAGEVE